MERLKSIPFSRKKSLTGLKKQFGGPSVERARGQALVSWLLILTLLLSLIFATSSAQVLLEHRLELTSICRNESLKTQAAAERGMKALLALNPQARFLRFRLLAAQIKLAQALASGQTVLIALARAEIEEIRIQQRSLDAKQKEILRTTNQNLRFGIYRTFALLQRTASHINSRSSDWANLQIRVENPRIIKLAVVEEDRQLAPVYSPKDDFENAQTIQFFWDQKYQLKGLLDENHRSRAGCLTSLEDKTWIPKIKKDKPSLRWL
jgi:hypothetical protein